VPILLADVQPVRAALELFPQDLMNLPLWSNTTMLSDDSLVACTV
jgi:hypothetical protein